LLFVCYTPFEPEVCIDTLALIFDG
jgi:hypothetical protein